jgi:DNA-binding LytR/AlgR family response regulator
MDTRLQKDLEVIYRKNYDNKMFKYSNNNVSLQLFYRSIKYLYKDKESRKVVVVADNVTYTICLNLNEALNMLDDRFKMVHRCCIVNTNRVIEYNWSKGYFVLDTLESVNFLSRKYKGTICK